MSTHRNPRTQRFRSVVKDHGYATHEDKKGITHFTSTHCQDLQNPINPDTCYDRTRGGIESEERLYLCVRVYVCDVCDVCVCVCECVIYPVLRLLKDTMVQEQLFLVMNTVMDSTRNCVCQVAFVS